MKKIVRKRIGKETHTFTVEGQNLFECQMEAQKLSFYDVYKCGCCGCEDLYLKAYVTDKGGYKYLKVCCPSCKSYINFGQQQQSPDTFYLRKNDDGSLKWERYDNNQDYHPDTAGYDNLMNKHFDI